jgi:PIN domain nuclease of toxin-antitoxin system
LKDIYILDACSLIAHFVKETGFEKILKLLKNAADEKIVLQMHKVNLLEFYYDIYKRAGRLKASCRLSLADAIGLGTAITVKGTFVTADRHEISLIEKQEKMPILWFR